MRKFSGLQTRLASLLRNRNSPNGPVSEYFYRQVETCQIPNLWYLYEKFLTRKSDGVFIEVGAYDGIFASNSWGLAEAGWNGFLIEPNPEFARICRENHRLHPAVHVEQVAIGPPSLDTIDLYLSGTLTTANLEQLREYMGIAWATRHVRNAPKIQVPSVTLDSFLTSRDVLPQFDVLIVDVEGFEREVFSGFSLSLWRPKMCIIELANTHPDLSTTAESDSRLQQEITTLGYTVAYKDAINTVFVDELLW